MDYRSQSSPSVDAQPKPSRRSGVRKNVCSRSPSSLVEEPLASPPATAATPNFLWRLAGLKSWSFLHDSTRHGRATRSRTGSIMKPHANYHRCMQCEDRPAIELPIPGSAGAFFCSIECAALHAVQMVAGQTVQPEEIPITTAAGDHLRPSYGLLVCSSCEGCGYFDRLGCPTFDSTARECLTCQGSGFITLKAVS